MNSETTEHAENSTIEKTQTAYTPYEYGNPYSNPYSNIQIPPPPPSPPRYKGFIAALVILSLLVVMLCGVLFYQSSQKRAITTIPTAIPNVSIIPTPTRDPNYTATDLLGDFQRAGANLGSIEYGTTIWSFSGNNYYVSVHATSSATWLDPPQADTSGVGLWVYSSISNAQSAYTQVGNDEISNRSNMPSFLIPMEYIHGRCLLLVDGSNGYSKPWSGYGQALEQYCI